MTESASSILASWSNFYIMIGSSAAALTGLMFVVISLVMGTERLRKSSDGISAFSTPTVVHFCCAFLIAAIFSAPWRSMAGPAWLLAIVGLFGVGYLGLVMVRTRKLTSYQPDLEDWAWYTVLPFVAYGVIFASAIALTAFPARAPFALAAGEALLIVIGIRNAWDIVTFIAIGGNQDEPPVRPT